MKRVKKIINDRFHSLLPGVPDMWLRTIHRYLWEREDLKGEVVKVCLLFVCSLSRLMCLMHDSGVLGVHVENILGFV